MQRSPELDDAVQDLAEQLGRRLLVLDQAMKVVAYSIHESPEDRRRLFHLLAHSDSWSRPPTATTPSALADLPEVGRVQFHRLLDSTRHIVGHLVIVLGDAGAEVPVAEASTDRLAQLLEARQAGSADRLATARSLTADLVVGDDARRKAAAAELLRQGLLSNSDSYCAVALGVDPRGATPVELGQAELAVAATLRFVRESSTATVTGSVLADHIGVLVFPRPVVVARLERILARPQTSAVRAGIGPLAGLTDLHRSFDRARWTWRASWLAPAEHPVVQTWRSVGLDGILARLPLEDFHREDLPALVADLLSQRPSAVLVDTLEAYLAAGGDAKRTAQLLRIHRSTLYYRLDQLRPLLVGDLADGVVRRELHVGLRLARMAGLLPGQ